MPSPLRWPLLLLVPLLAFGAALRLWPAGESLWLDELHTAWCAMSNLDDVAGRAAIGNQSPLFFWLQWLLVRAFGASEMTLRLPSLVAGTLLPAAVFFLARRWTGSGWPGLLAAALVAFDPLMIFYATEARPYALIQLLAVAHVALVAELAQQPSGSLRAGFILGAALLFYLHYTAALFIAAEIAFLALLPWIAPSSRYRWPQCLTDAALVGLLAIPALGHLQAIFARRENWAGFVPRPPVANLFLLLNWSAAAWFVAVALVGPACRAGPWRAKHSGTVHERERNAPDARGNVHCAIAYAPYGVLALAWLLVPLVVAWIATATDVARIFLPRYLAVSAPAAMVLAAMCAAIAPDRWGKIAVGLAIFAGGLTILAVPIVRDGRVIRGRYEDWRGAVAWLNGELPEHRYPVLVRSGLVESNALRQPHSQRLEDYCLLPVTSLYHLQVDRSQLVSLPSRNPGLIDDELSARLHDRSGAWLVVRAGRADAAEAAAGQLLRRLRGKGSGVDGGKGLSMMDDHRPPTTPDPLGVAATVWHVTDSRSFGGVHVFRLEVGP